METKSEIDRLMDLSDKGRLTSWETDFVKDVKRLKNMRVKISEKQKSKVKELLAKYERAEK